MSNIKLEISRDELALLLIALSEYDWQRDFSGQSSEKQAEAKEHYDALGLKLTAIMDTLHGMPGNEERN